MIAPQMISDAKTAQTSAASDAPAARNATVGISIMPERESTAYCSPMPAASGNGAFSSTW